MRYTNDKGHLIYTDEKGVNCAAEIRAQSIFRYRSRRYVSGPMLEEEAYPIFLSKKEAGRAKKAVKTSKAQDGVNERNAHDMLNRYVSLNFVERVDMEIGLDYFVQPKTPEEAQRFLTAWIRHTRKIYAALGVELKYIYVTPWLTKTGRVVKRLHHHIIINNAGLSIHQLMELWPHGRTHADPLQPDRNGLLGLSSYLCNHLHGSKRYVPSKNLIKPEPQYLKPIGKRKTSQLATNYELARSYFEEKYPEHEFVKMEIRTSEFVSGAYLHVWMRRRDAWCPRYINQNMEGCEEHADLQGLRRKNQVYPDSGREADAG